MRIRLSLSAALVAALAAPLHASDVTATLTAVDGKCIADTSNTNWNDNRLRAYFNNSSQGAVDGFVRFDLSSIPDGATITALDLTCYHEQGFGNPSNGPVVTVHRVASDTWSKSQNDNHPGLAEQLTLPDSGPFPSGDLVPVNFSLDVSAADWSQDLADDALSLALHNENAALGIYSYVYFYNSNPTPAPPTLTVRYTTGPHLKLDNFVAGANAVVSMSSFTPNGQAALLLSGTPGPLAISSACGTQSFDVGLPVFLFFLPLGPTGTLTLAGPLPSNLTGVTLYFHALDVQSCEQSNAAAVTVG